MTISVITATYNSAATVRNTFESVLAQSYKDIEYIVIDGASTDGTVDIIREYEKRFNGRMRWISEKDSGLYEAMNKGIRLSKGEVLGILNSDDFFSDSGILDTVAKEMEGVDAIYGDIHYVNEQDLSEPVRYYSSAMFRPWKMIMGFMPAHPSFYCRRNVYDRFGTFDTEFKVAADFELLLRLIYIGKISTKYLPVDFVTMRTGGISTSGMQSHRRILRDHMLAYKKNGVYSNYFLEGLRYAYKIYEIAAFRLWKVFNRR